MREAHPREVLHQLEQSAKRRFGQHFLADEFLVDGIVRGAGVSPGDRVLEVGPGLGILTRALLRAGADLTAVELDRDLAAYLREALPAVRLIEGDAARLDWAEVCPGQGWKIVANLPYNVGTGLVVDWLRGPRRFASLTVMLQWEVVQRLLAPPGSKTYGAVSVLAAAYAEGRLLRKVPPGAFHPPPKVESAVVHFDLQAEPRLEGVPAAHFETVVRAGFAQRRKTLVNSLASRWPREVTVQALSDVGLRADVRAEALSLRSFLALASALPVAGEAG